MEGAAALEQYKAPRQTDNRGYTNEQGGTLALECLMTLSRPRKW